MNREIKFASMVEKYMRMNGLTMKELGEKVGRGESTVSMWIANKSTPPMGIVQKLADLFGVTTDVMIYGDDSSDIALTDHERKHLEIYRSLDDKGQHTVDTVTQMEYERVKKEKSIWNFKDLNAEVL